MPLVKYFGFVGSALVMLLLGVSWYFPQPATESVHGGIDKSAIRISSIEKPLERVVIDTSLPTIVPPLSTVAAAEQPPQAALATPGPLPTVPTIADGALKKQSAAKRYPLKRLASHRSASPANATPGYTVQATEPVTRMSLLDVIKERFGRSLFKLH